MSNEAEKRLIARVKRENPNDGDTLTYDDLVELCAAELLAADDDELVEEGATVIPACKLLLNAPASTTSTPRDATSVQDDRHEQLRHHLQG